MAQSEARRWGRRLWGATGVYLICMFGTMQWMSRDTGVPQWMIALVPLPAVLLMTYAAVRRVRELDELQRRIQVDGLAFGFVGGGLVTITIGLLQTAGVADMNWIWAWGAMALCWALGVAVARLRYR